MKDGAVYEDMLDFKALKKYMEDQMEDYNMEPGVIAMNLVLFRDAIEHGEYKKWQNLREIVGEGGWVGWRAWIFQLFFFIKAAILFPRLFYSQAVLDDYVFKS